MYIDMSERIAGKQNESSFIIKRPKAPKYNKIYIDLFRPYMKNRLFIVISLVHTCISPLSRDVPVPKLLYPEISHNKAIYYLYVLGNTNNSLIYSAMWYTITCITFCVQYMFFTYSIPSIPKSVDIRSASNELATDWLSKGLFSGGEHSTSWNGPPVVHTEHCKTPQK